MIIILTIITILLAGILIKQVHKNEAISSQTSVGLVILIVIGLLLLYFWPEGNKEYFSYNNLYKINNIKTTFIVQYLIAGLAVITFTSYYLKESELKLPKEYYILIIFSLIGGVLIILSNNLLSLYIALELQSFGVYLVAAIKNKHLLSIKSALIYFLLGGLSSTFILLGTGLIYSIIGSTDNETLRLSLANSDNIKLGLVLILIYVGLSFKLALVPFHMWAPDVYDGVPTIITAWINIMPKLPIIYVIIFLGQKEILEIQYFFLITMLSLLLGSFLGVMEPRIKRLFVYSSTGNLGYVIIGKILYLNTVDISCCYIFLVGYVVGNLAVFFILIAIGKTEKEYQTNPSRKYSRLQLISDLKHQWYINKFLSFALIITLLSLAGIPYLFGFYGKLFIIKTAIDNGIMSILVAIILNTLVSSFFYLRVIKTVLYKKEEINLSKKFEEKTIVYDAILLMIISLLIGFMVVFTLVPNYIINLSSFLTAIFV